MLCAGLVRSQAAARTPGGDRGVEHNTRLPGTLRGHSIQSTFEG